VSWTTCAKGIDESSCQGTIDFDKLKAGGFDFVIAKGTQGLQGVDPTYVERVQAARRAGLLVPLMYHVLTVAAPVDAQVKNACDHADSLDLDIGLDFEIDGNTAAQALAFANGCWARGRKVVLYSYPNFMKRIQEAVTMEQLAKCVDGYWSASYPNNQKVFPPPDSVQPWVPAVFHGRWLFWQCSGDGGLSAPGVPGVVDHNLFNGTVADLTAWMTGTKSEVGS